MAQGGDIDKGDGTGITSIYGGTFDDEQLGWRDMDAAGLVCSANRGKDTNGSQSVFIRTYRRQKKHEADRYRTDSSSHWWTTAHI